MKDSWGDEIYLYKDMHGVSLYCLGASGTWTDMLLTPKQARKLAKELLKKAKGVEAIAL